MKSPTDQEITKFGRVVWNYYKKHGRDDLPWRKKTDPYSIVVSEIMLQQTQVVRVLDYYRNWMKMFPSWSRLAEASLRTVLLQWKGLGYNRRGKYLHDISKQIVGAHKNKFPQDYKDILKLPGIGPYTAAAITAFSYNQPATLVETNIRTVIIHHFFADSQSVREKQIEAILERCMKKGSKAYKNPREWYWALMDYGSHLKTTVGNLNKQSKTYNKQSRFEGSRRQLRSRLLQFIAEHKTVTDTAIKDAQHTQSRQDEVAALLSELEQEGMITKTKGRWRIA